MNPGSRVLRFYFDYISHNAYIAWTQLPALCEKYGCVIEPVPVLFAGLLKAHRQMGPAEVPPKLRWMLANTLRKAALLGIPLNPPANHPFNPLLALRASSLEMSNEQRCAVVDALFRTVWVDGRDVMNPAAIAAAVQLPGRDMLEEASEEPAKTRVRQQTEDAIANGVFGVPTMVVNGQLFWGYDDFPYLELVLAGKDPIKSGEFERWAGVTPSARRKESLQH